MHRVLFAVLLTAAVSGCATNEKLQSPAVSLRRAGLADEQQAEHIRRRLTDGDIADWLDADIQPRLPTPLAVAKLVPAGWDQQYPDQFTLEALDDHELDGWREAVAGIEGIQEVRPMPRMLASGSCVRLEELRHAAARMGCEMLLVYARADSHVDNFTDAAVLYWSILGLWLVPGNVGEHETVMQAVVLDTRTGMVLAAATGSHHIKKHYANAYRHNRRAEMTSEARQEALANLQERFSRAVSRLGA
ncbi:MAG: hypothetical protein ACP5HU_05100 [Phycisphaerae bacterium]